MINSSPYSFLSVRLPMPTAGEAAASGAKQRDSMITTNGDASDGRIQNGFSRNQSRRDSDSSATLIPWNRWINYILSARARPKTIFGPANSRVAAERTADTGHPRVFSSESRLAEIKHHSERNFTRETGDHNYSEFRGSWSRIRCSQIRL